MTEDVDLFFCTNLPRHDPGAASIWLHMMDERCLEDVEDVQLDGEQKEVPRAVSYTGRGSAISMPT